MKRRTRTLAINGTLTAVLVGGSIGAYLLLTGSPSEASSKGTRVVAATTGDVSSTVSASGTVAAVSEEAQNFTTSGAVTSIKVKVGDTVKKGQVLATIDDADAESDLSLAEANYSAAVASYNRALDGTTTTDARTGASSTTVDTSSVAQAKAQKLQAAQQLEDAEDAVAGTTLKASIAGTVLEVNGIVGSSTSSSSSSNGAADGAAAADSSSGDFIVIADLTKLEVGVSFSEADTVGLKVGQSATVTFPANDDVTATGKLTAIDPQGTSSSSGVVTFNGVVTITGELTDIRIGQSASVEIINATAKDAVLVPALAVTTTGDRSTVTVVKDGAETVTPVELGVEGATYTQITSGIAAGDNVLVPTGSSSEASSTGTGGMPGGGGFAGGGPQMSFGGTP